MEPANYISTLEALRTWRTAQSPPPVPQIKALSLLFPFLEFLEGPYCFPFRIPIIPLSGIPTGRGALLFPFLEFYYLFGNP